MVQSVPKVSKVQPPNRGRERIEVRVTKETTCCLRAADFAAHKAIDPTMAIETMTIRIFILTGQTVKGSQRKLVP